VAALSVALITVGLLLAAAGCIYLIRDTVRLRRNGLEDPGLGGLRGVALAALFVGLNMTVVANLLVRL
jgi:hypothetical protein